ncbi:MAG: signal peptidase II [Clostridiaceae bacterium]|nr:signal peptidase II [Clostridiaceae bacterium]
MKRIPKLVLSIISILLLVGLDQVTKKLAEINLAGKGTIPVLGNFLVLNYITNRGGFLSFGSGISNFMWHVFFIILPLVSLIAISIFIIIKKRNDAYFLSFWVFFTSGGVGNIIDRILYGEVRDFLNIGIGSLRTGIFNVADIYLNVFALLVVLIYIFRKKGKSEIS